jgi:hypothetical protein
MDKTNVAQLLQEHLRPRSARSVLLALFFVVANTTAPIALSYFPDEVFDELDFIVAANILLALCGVLFLLAESAIGLARLRQGRFVPAALHFTAGSLVMAALLWGHDLLLLGQILDLLFL